MCRCLSCNRKLSSREMTRKYSNWEEIKNPEDRYVSLCSSCFNGSVIKFAEINPLLPDNDGETLEDVNGVENKEQSMNIYYPDSDNEDTIDEVE